MHVLWLSELSDDGLYGKILIKLEPMRSLEFTYM